jgi:hypothetical protein
VSSAELFRQGLASSSSSPGVPADAQNRPADPTLLNERSEYPQAPSRPDQSTIGAGGNRVSAVQLNSVRTRGRVGAPNRTSPSGQPEIGGLGYQAIPLLALQPSHPGGGR